MNELNQLQNLTAQVGDVLGSWSDVMVPTANASAPAITSCPVENLPLQQASHSDEFRWNGIIAPGAAIEVQGINGEIIAEPTSGSEVQVSALKTSRRSDVNAVKMKVVQHAGGVTICALYPNEDGDYPGDCGPGDGQSKERSGSGNMRNNDVQVNFTVRVPQGVSFVGKTVNGGINATSLTGNVITRTINGSIKISTSGYAEAQTINGEINARLGDANWPRALTFQTINGEVNLELPSSLSTSVDAQTLNGGFNSDFPLTITTQISKKRVKGVIGPGGRELVLKTINGSINLRKAG
jgi:hypothetical protein